MTPNFAVWIVVALVAAAIGWVLGRGAGRAGLLTSIGTYARSLAPGNPGPVPQELAGLHQQLRTHWSPKGSELDEATGRALERITSYLQHNVEAPLKKAASAPPMLLKDSVDEALGALADLEFFAVLPDVTIGAIELRKVVNEVADEYSEDAGVEVKVASARGIRVLGNAERLKDALFLVLHNAGQFGDGSDVEIGFDTKDGTGRVIIGDRGPGFTADALSKAYDPFYSTSPSGLGLGLTHARRLIEAMKGGTHLRNREGGGAEVEIGLPLA